MSSTTKLTSSELSLFCYQLSMVMKSGLPLMESMEIMKDEFQEKHLRDIMAGLSEGVGMGQSLSESFSSREVFPDYFLSMITIAEKTGTLEEELVRLNRFYESKARVEKRIRDVFVYPTVLLVMMLGVIIFLVTRVIPMFAGILQSMGVNAPPQTQRILNVGMSLKNNGLIILGVIAAIIIIINIWKRSEKGRASWDKMKLNFPGFKSINRAILTSRFANGLYLMMHSGMSLSESLEYAEGVLENDWVTGELQKHAHKVAEGQPLSDILKEIHVFPRLFVRMIELGERTGEMETTLEKASIIFSDDAARRVDNISSSIEPALVIILSVIVGIVLLSVMIPLINVISTIG